MDKLIYIADDEENICNLIKSFLQKSGFNVKTFNTSKALLDDFYSKPSDLVIFDIMMPGMDGLTACTILRNMSSVPIIVVSAKDSDLDKATAINLGCDDYLTKPFSLIELLARVKSIFRRIDLDKGVQANSNILFFSDLVVNKNQFSAQINNIPLNLTKNEFSLIVYLIENKNRAVSRDELLRKVWDFKGKEIDTRATDDAIKRLRKKLLANNSKVYIKTIRGFGFKIFEEITNE